MFRKRKEEKTEQGVPDPAEDTCQLCGGKGRLLFEDYLECVKCKHIFRRKEKILKKGVCPVCGASESNPLFGDEVECKKCGYVYKSR